MQPNPMTTGFAQHPSKPITPRCFMFEKRYKTRLLIQRQTGLYRNPPQILKREGKYLYLSKHKVLNFSSNDYLGLGASRQVMDRVAENFRKYGPSSSSSRLVSGNYSIIHEAEAAYADYFGYESALFFPSGYQANVGLISTLFEKGDRVIFDKHIHASSVKGIELSKAGFSGYTHNTLSHLEKKLRAGAGKQMGVVTESLFSMDGDLLDVEGISRLKKQYNFFSIVDEAHAFGILGTLNGRAGTGIAAGAADVALGTFGKALGLFGAVALLPQEVKNYMFNFCSSLIYSTTLPPAHAASALDILRIMAEAHEERDHLRRISSYMKDTLRQEGFRVEGDAHILSIFVGDEDNAATLSTRLLEKGLFVFPARYPTVPVGKAILRVGMTALHTKEDINRFVVTLKETFSGRPESRRKV